MDLPDQNYPGTIATSVDLRKPTGTLAKYCPAKWINAEGNPEESLPTNYPIVSSTCSLEK
jgi:hypothetical protein